MERKIEPIDEKHFEGLVALFNEFAAFEKRPDKMTNSVQQMMDEKDYVKGFVALNADNAIVAYVTFHLAYYTWSGKSLYMDDLYVTEPFRGQGLGTLLVDEVISFARSNNCKKLRWQVSSWNERAIEFYEAIGAEINKVDMNCDLTLVR